MNRNARTQDGGPAANGYMLLECLAYIAVVTVLLGCGFAGLYRVIGNSTRLRLSADDIGVALETGERWRSEIRAAQKVEAGDRSLRLELPQGEVSYEFRGNAVYRRVGTNSPVRVLSNVKGSEMQPQTRETVRVWAWELELTPRSKAARVQPRFTFLAVPAGGAKP